MHKRFDFFRNPLTGLSQDRRNNDGLFFVVKTVSLTVGTFLRTRIEPLLFNEKREELDYPSDL